MIDPSPSEDDYSSYDPTDPDKDLRPLNYYQDDYQDAEAADREEKLQELIKAAWEPYKMLQKEYMKLTGQEYKWFK